MAFGYYAFIDESGDEGFAFRDPLDRGSSQWFVLSAIVVRASRRLAELRAFRDFIAENYKGKGWQSLHFRNLRHE